MGVELGWGEVSIVYPRWLNVSDSLGIIRQPHGQSMQNSHMNLNVDMPNTWPT